MFRGPLERVSMQPMAWSVRHWVTADAEGAPILDAPYQRGSVWDADRQRNLVRSLFRGIPTGAILYNDIETVDGPVSRIVDGKQRIEAVRAFLSDDLLVPATWFTDPGKVLEVLPFWPVPAVRHSVLPIGVQRRFANLPMPALRAQLATVEEEAELFDLINTGGVPQTAATLAHARRVAAG